MATFFNTLNLELQNFIAEQKVFFVATAMEKGRINLSPKGMDTFRVQDEQTVLWLNLTGSGNETATHVQHSPRMTIMFCAFDGKPLILRLYGQATVYHPRDSFFQKHITAFSETAGARQIFELKIDSVQTSCGYSVPLMEYAKDRAILKNWAEKQGTERIKEYWKNKNKLSIDGHESNILT